MIERFIDAQESSYSGYETALKEMKNGCKTSHWIWYIFPQLVGLGTSRMCQTYGICGLDEAKEYINHPVLGKRLIEISNVLLQLANPNIREIMGSSIDVRKLCSSMTLFSIAEPNEKVFQNVLDKYFDGKICKKTIKLIDSKS